MAAIFAQGRRGGKGKRKQRGRAKGSKNQSACTKNPNALDQGKDPFIYYYSVVLD